MQRKPAILAVFLVAIVLGAVREFFFVNLNYAIDHLANHRAYSYAHSAFTKAVVGWTLPELSRLKWVAALLFVAIQLILAILLARVLFGDHRLRRPLLWGTLAVGSFALLLNLASSLHPAFGLVSVKLLHALQYPVALILLLVASSMRSTSVS